MARWQQPVPSLATGHGEAVLEGSDDHRQLHILEEYGQSERDEPVQCAFRRRIISIRRPQQSQGLGGMAGSRTEVRPARKTAWRLGDRSDADAAERILLYGHQRG